MGPYGADDGPGWIWTVYPAYSGNPMVAVGHSGNQAKAQEATEHALLDRPDGAFGIVIGPRGEQVMCRRTTDGGFTWRAFSEPVG